MRTTPFWCLLVLISCTKPKTEVSQTPIPSATVSAALPPVTAPAPPPVDRVSVALFNKERLVACGDHWLTQGVLNPPADAGMTAESLQAEDLEVFLKGGKSFVGKLVRKLKDPGAKDSVALKFSGEGQQLKKLCAEQFPGRTTIGRCRIGGVVTGGAKPILFGVETHSYVVDTDTFARQCIANGGDWSELAKDSLEFMQAKHEQALDELKRKIE
jgi:hypothetical protein